MRRACLGGIVTGALALAVFVATHEWQGALWAALAAVWAAIALQGWKLLEDAMDRQEDR